MSIETHRVITLVLIATSVLAALGGALASDFFAAAGWLSALFGWLNVRRLEG